MFQKKEFVIFIIIMIVLNLVYSGCVTAQRIEEIPSQNKSNQNKEDFVFFEINSLSITKNEFEEINSKIREFIWKHWKNQKDGTLKLRAVSKEGKISISKYIIKELKDGQWGIIVTIKRLNTGKKDGFFVEEVDRIELPKDDFEKEEVIPRNVTRSSKSYRIRLKDNSGKVLQEI